jgi:isoleucyl-tRNA synthetase
LGGVGLVGWTTTPWTTLANAGVAAHPELFYKVVEHPARPGERLLIGEELATAVPVLAERDGKRVQLDLRDQPALARFRGRDLEGLTYERLFTFLDPEVAGRVVLGDYVTAAEGTGLVHTAPPFGEDDYQTGRRYGLPLWLTVDADGRIVAGAGPFAGQWFKDADPKIVQDLKARGLLLHSDRHRHSYPFCWRCDRPLLYYATKSWFIQTTAEKGKLVAFNRDRIRWRPEHVGEGRFGNWLENVVDWALSRRRYWGTPLPIWRCDRCDAQPVVIGSYEDLFRAAGQPMPADVYDRQEFDPHRPYIDRLTWGCPACGAGTMRRVEDVIDAWFDSGAMPFAQRHYMGKPLPEFDPGAQRGFPADFISEAVDQTRGWFYTLHVLGVLLFDNVAYENCVVLGHVNDEQGRKMSKRLGNVIEPMQVIAETGADALRWYFCVNDPEQPSRFSARLVREAAQSFLLPLWNALSFFTIYANLDEWRPEREAPPPLAERPDLDRWILLRLDDAREQVTVALESYAIAPAARQLDRFLDDLTNWYIRRSRARFWAGNPESRDKEAAYHTLYRVLTTLARLLAPFTPFLAEELHRRLERSLDRGAESVHLESWPEAAGHAAELEQAGDSPRALVQAMSLAQRIVGLGRAARATHDLKTRQPLARATLVFSAEALGGDIQGHIARVRDIITDELNVKELDWAERRTDYVRHEVRPNFRVLGKRLGPLLPRVKAALEAADGDQLAEALARRGWIDVAANGETVRLESSDLEVRLQEKEGQATAGDRELLVALDTQLTAELIAEGWAREVVHRLQAARKAAQLDYADRIRVRYQAAAPLAAAIAAHRGWIAGETLAVELEAGPVRQNLQTESIDEHDFAFAIERA